MSEIGSLDSEGQPAWLLIACFIVVLACNLTGWIATQSKKWASQTATQRLLDEISSLRKSAAQHNQPSTYAVSAKYQRQANAKEKELKALQEVVPTSSRVESLTSIVKRVFITVCVIAFWKQPVLRTWTEPLWPMNRFMLRVPHRLYLEPDCVSVLAWLMLSNRVTNLLARLVYPEPASAGASAARGAAAGPSLKED